MPVLWTPTENLLLASTSATRLRLLMGAGIMVETQKPGVDERAIETMAQKDTLDPLALAARLAAEKALAVSRRHPERIVLGADQILACGDIVFHKAPNRKAASRKLQALSGKTHFLHSAGAIAIGGEVVERFDASARLTMRALTDEALELYLDLAGPDVLQSVGVYHYESLGAHLFENVEGDHSTILGLPLLPLLSALRRLGCLSL